MYSRPEYIYHWELKKALDYGRSWDEDSDGEDIECDFEEHMVFKAIKKWKKDKKYLWNCFVEQLGMRMVFKRGYLNDYCSYYNYDNDRY